MKASPSIILFVLLALVSIGMLCVVMLASLFIACGYIISSIFPLPLVSATAVCIGATFSFAFLAFIVVYSAYQSQVKILSGSKNDGFYYPASLFRSDKPENKKKRQAKKPLKTTILED